MRALFTIFSAFLLAACSTRPTVEPVVDPPAVEPTTAPRPIYRYSVLPGGVRSAEELRAKLADDPVARAHYADVRPGVTVTAPEIYRYVSYRKGDRIFWTAQKLAIPAGEPLIDLGDDLVRQRCGNRLSHRRRWPIESPLVAPSPAELDTIIDYDPPTLPQELPALKDQPLVTTPPRVAWTPTPQPFVAMAGKDSHTFFSDPFMPGMLQRAPVEPGLATPSVPGESPSPATPSDPLLPIGNYPVIPDGSFPIEPSAPGKPDPSDPLPPGPITEPPDDPEKPVDPPARCCDVPIVPDDPKHFPPEPPVVSTPEPGTLVSVAIAAAVIAIQKKGKR